MNKVFIIDGGAGRALAAIPALKKYIRENPDQNIKILVYAWDSLYWGIPDLQDITFNPDQKGIFDSVLLNADEVVSPEPYRVPGYYKQELSISQAFNKLINNTDDHSDLGIPEIVLSKQEEVVAAKMIADVNIQLKPAKTIVFQPFGKSSEKVGDNIVVDYTSRSLEPDVYLYLLKKLNENYNIVYFGDGNLILQEDNISYKPTADMRQWAAFIEAADYFIGCDSLGQHIARAFNKPGTVILGSTFAVNTTYPDWFNIVEKKDAKKYSPIRISGLESHLADRYNDKSMTFSDNELLDIYNNIVNDIESKTKI